MKKGKILATILILATAASAALPASAWTFNIGRDVDMLGDANGDASITSEDALVTLRISVDIADTPDQKTFYFLDIDDDKDITSSDAMMILRESVSIGADISVDTAETPETPENALDGINSFSADLFKECSFFKKGENTIVSPLSVYYALAMLENGANGDTQSEILNTLYKGGSEEALNSALAALMANYNSGDTLQIANALYVTDREDVVMRPVFGETIKNTFGGDVFIAPPDAGTVNMLNDWISEKTNHMINNVLPPSALNEDTNSVIINALHFKAEWSEQYEDYQIHKEDFTCDDGTQTEQDFLHETGGVFYQDENACAFRKWYSGNYSFIGILPDKTVGVNGYISQMNENTIKELLSHPQYGYDVYTSIPKFDLGCDMKLNADLQQLGIRDAFSPMNADLTRIAQTGPGRNIYVDLVRHLTRVKLDEYGTEAAAVTVIMNTDACIDSEEPKPIKKIYLNRPFIFVLYDEANEIPIFIGAVNTL